MEAVILAGGLGTRLRTVVQDLPKPMAPIAGRPFLALLLNNLAHHGFKRVILSVGHLAEKISDEFGARFAGLDLTYVVEDKPLGTGGALAEALPHCRSDHVFVLNGDTFLDLEFAQVEELWLRARIPVMVLREVSNTARYGRIDLDGNRIARFREKGLSGRGMINAGCYVLPRNLLATREDKIPFSFEGDFLPDAIQKVPFLGFVSDGLFIDIGMPEDYQQAQTLLLPWLP